MHPFFQDFLQRLTDLHQDILRAIDDLPPEALEWTPSREDAADMNSINILVEHLCGAERYWIGDVACNDPSGRVRAEEFQVSDLDAAYLFDKINTATNFAQTALEKLNIDDLGKAGSALGAEQVFTVGWALLHALEHTAQHLGHIQITRQLWDEKE